MFGDDKGIFDEILPISSSVFDDLTFNNDTPVFGEDENILGMLKSHFQEQEGGAAPSNQEVQENTESEGLIFNSVDEASLDTPSDLFSQIESKICPTPELEAGGD